MKFKDLPSRKETVSFFKKVYGVNHTTWASGGVFLVHKKPRSVRTRCLFSKHQDVYAARRYMESNPEVEFLDDFFGNNFPFLQGSIHDYRSTSKIKFFKEFGKLHRSQVGITIGPLQVLREVNYGSLNNICDLRMSYSGLNGDAAAYDNALNSIYKKNRYVCEYGNMLFSFPTYDELVKIIDIIKIMER